MYLDISSHQGFINWKEVASQKDITGIILRSTTKNGKLDTRTLENYNGILQNISGQLVELSVYKFSYVRDYASARIEALKTVHAIAEKGIHFDNFYLDMEMFDGREYTTKESSEVILGYFDALSSINQAGRLAIYTNYNYIKNILDRDIAGPFKIWLAKWSDNIGDISGWNVKLWQYTDRGHVPGISTNVDLSRPL